MLAAVENDVLANPLWKGTAEDIHLAFAEGDPRRQQVEGLSFSEDYFPHGGVVGAARLGLPRAIVEAPPESLGTVVNPNADLLDRLGAALDYLQNYILDESEVGTLGFYVPAPNPPIFTDGDGNPLSPRELMELIGTFDPSLALSSDLYPLETAFLQGYMDGQLLGIPIARGEVTAFPPSADEPGRLLVSTEIPEGSWMQSFVESAEMTFEMKQAPPRRIEENFAEWTQLLEQFLASSPTPEEQSVFLADLLAEMESGLPNASLDLAVNNFRIPAALEPVLALDGSTSARDQYRGRSSTDSTAICSCCFSCCCSSSLVSGQLFIRSTIPHPRVV
jgi:hypothetical protein